MEGYEVVTSDDARLGHVAGTVGDNLIVEHGTLRKSRHALPNAFVHVDDEERVVRTTLSKQLIEQSPKLGDGDVDEEEIAAYYGLTEGGGRDDLESADQQAQQAGLLPHDQGRAQIRQRVREGGTYGPPGRQVIPPNAHEVGGKEYRED
ncbi:MAG: hypothetical protein ACRDN6_03220 [Gaiellaceae bacterium]